MPIDCVRKSELSFDPTANHSRPDLSQSSICCQTVSWNTRMLEETTEHLERGNHRGINGRPRGLLFVQSSRQGRHTQPYSPTIRLQPFSAPQQSKHAECKLIYFIRTSKFISFTTTTLHSLRTARSSIPLCAPNLCVRYLGLIYPR